MRNGRNGSNGHTKRYSQSSGNGKSRQMAVYMGWISRFNRDGWKLFEKKDYTQASEKFWGAAAQILKAIAEKRGWHHNGHAEFFKIIDKIANELNDKEMRSLFLMASSLHTNFYEHWLTPKEVQDGAESVGRLIERLKPLLNKH